jgi:hypothetical protein
VNERKEWKWNFGSTDLNFKTAVLIRSTGGYDSPVMHVFIAIANPGPQRAPAYESQVVDSDSSG